MAHKLYTIGHSAAPLYTFLAALKKWKVKLLVDVRSRPSSRRFPHFNQTNLEKALRPSGIDYLFLGSELGGRPDDPKAYDSDGVVDYARWRQSRAFHAGLKRVQNELSNCDLALMCAEEDPLECHRFLMICPEFTARGIEPLHIRKGGVIETEREAEDRLLKQHKLAAVANGSLFSADRDSALQTTYLAQAKRHAFRRDPAKQDSSRK
jgi:uncharacterized protein (DUF488 family)